MRSKMLSSALLTVSWKAWLINEITSHLQGTILPEEQIKARHKFFARRYNVDIWKSSHEQSTPPWHPDGAIRGSYEMIIFTPSSELTSEIVNFIHLWKSCLKIKVVSKMCKNCFLKSKISYLDIKVKFHESNKNQRCFQIASESPFSNFPPPTEVEILRKQKPHL